jgi:hypothetical protein
VEDTFRRERAAAAFKRFAVLAAVNYADREPDVMLAPPTPERTANLSFFSPTTHRPFAGVSALSVSVITYCVCMWKIRAEKCSSSSCYGAGREVRCGAYRVSGWPVRRMAWRSATA